MSTNTITIFVLTVFVILRSSGLTLVPSGIFS